MINQKSKEDLNIINEYLKMINEQKINQNKLKEAITFINVYKQPSRIKCEVIGCNAIKDVLLKNDVFKTIPKGLSKKNICKISKLKTEPKWMLQFSLKSYEEFKKISVLLITKL